MQARRLVVYGGVGALMLALYALVTAVLWANRGWDDSGAWPWAPFTVSASALSTTNGVWATSCERLGDRVGATTGVRDL
jgi:hypothetical protein